MAYSISLSLAAFAFIGVEIPAATALEARVQENTITKEGPVDKTVKFSAVWGSLIIGSIYVLGALLVSFNLDWDDPQLPRLSWLSPDSGAESGSTSKGATNRPDSAFVIAAYNSTIPRSQTVADFITVCLLITALTTANTILYVASRTMFSPTKSIEDTPDSPLIMRFLAFFGKTSHRRVPMRAVAASCCFCWVPFLYLSDSNAPGFNLVAVSISMKYPPLVDILTLTIYLI